MHSGFELKGNLFIRSCIAFFFLFSVCFLLNGCATLLTGTKQSIKVDSEPRSAKVYVDSALKGKTPMYLQLEKQMGGTKIRMRSEAFGTQSFRADVGFNSYTVGNLANPVGWGVDLLTGSFFQYGDRYYKVEMKTDSIGQRQEEVDYYQPDPQKRGSMQSPEVEVKVRDRIPVDNEEPKKKFLGFSYPILTGGFAREIGGQVVYKPFRRFGFELGGGYQIKSPYWIVNLVDQNQNPNIGGKGYSIRASFDFYPLGGLSYRGKKMDRWGFNLEWRDLTTGKFWIQNTQQPSLQEQVRDRVSKLKVTISRGASWSWDISGNLGWFLETRLGVGMRADQIQRQKFKGRKFKGSPVLVYPEPKGQPDNVVTPTFEVDIRLGIGTLYEKNESPFQAGR